jgi:hypothetical protein
MESVSIPGSRIIRRFNVTGIGMCAGWTVDCAGSTFAEDFLEHSQETTTLLFILVIVLLLIA